MKVLEDTPAVLSLGKLCDEHGYSYEWINGQKPTSHLKRYSNTVQYGKPRTNRGSWFINEFFLKLAFFNTHDILYGRKLIIPNLPQAHLPHHHGETCTGRITISQSCQVKVWIDKFGETCTGRIGTAIRGEGHVDFLGESEGSLPQPHDSLPDAGEAINDFWSMSGSFIYRHHVLVI